MLTISDRQWQVLEEGYWARILRTLVVEARRDGAFADDTRPDGEIVDALLPIVLRAPDFGIILPADLRWYAQFVVRIGRDPETDNGELGRAFTDPDLVGGRKLAALAHAAGTAWPSDRS